MSYKDVVVERLLTRAIVAVGALEWAELIISPSSIAEIAVVVASYIWIMPTNKYLTVPLHQKIGKYLLYSFPLVIGIAMLSPGFGLILCGILLSVNRDLKILDAPDISSMAIWHSAREPQ